MRTSVGKVFAFDMDGVVVDTIASLHRCYLEFLRDYGVNGTREEFDRLNGPKIVEIVRYLKNAHGLEPPEEQLKGEYVELVERVYDDVQPVAKVQHLIEHLRSKNVELALVSSSPRGIIDQVLKRFRLTECFSEIISGDEVSRAKPSPDIYEAVQRRFSGKKIYVIEDSPLGIASACAAGLDVIAFGPSSNHQKSVLYQCQSMDEVYQASEEILSSAEVVTMFKHLELRFDQEAWPLTAEQRKRVEKRWDRAKVEDSALFSGPVTVHRAHSQHDKFLYIECVEMDYKIVLAHLRGDDLGITVTPLGVSGILVDARGRTLLGRRNSVTEYRGWYELVPSGALSGQRTEDQVRQELVEETGMDPGVITAIDPFCLILDERHQVYDIGCRIDVDLELSSDTRKSRGEYENLHWVDLAQVDDFLGSRSCVPTSLALWEAFQSHFS